MSAAAMSLSNLSRLFRRANANKGRVVRSLANTGRHGFWAMADQGVASIGNFGIMFLLGREFVQRGALQQYGDFGMLFELMWCLNSIQGALIIYPLTIKGAMADRAGLTRLAGAAALLTLFCAPVIGAAALGMAWVINSLSVGLWAALAAILWQLQETVRRALMAELRFRAAIVGDSIRYIGHVVAMAIISHWYHLSLEITFQTMAVASAVALIVQGLQVGIRFPVLSSVMDFGRESWKLGRWVLAGNASSLVTTLLYTANFRFWWGGAVVGIAFALNNLLRLTNPLMFSVVSLITPHAARARAVEGMWAAKRQFLKFSAMGALLLVPYLGFLILFPSWSIRLALDSSYEKYWWILVISAISQGLIYIAQVSGVFLNAVERNRTAFVGAVAFSVAFMATGMPLTMWLGLPGAAMGGVFGSLAQIFVNAYGYAKLPAREDLQTRPHPVPPPRGFEVIPAPVTVPPTPGSLGTTAGTAPGSA